jgi:Transposase IS116/IS110/IS902 family
MRLVAIIVVACCWRWLSPLSTVCLCVSRRGTMPRCGDDTRALEVRCQGLSPARRCNSGLLASSSLPSAHSLAGYLPGRFWVAEFDAEKGLHPGVGPLTALAYELVIGTPERFHCGKQIASYVGLVPEEKSSGDRRRLGHISKQGNAVTHYFAFCWWKQHRPQYAANHSGRVGSFILL